MMKEPRTTSIQKNGKKGKPHWKCYRDKRWTHQSCARVLYFCECIRFLSNNGTGKCGASVLNVAARSQEFSCVCTRVFSVSAQRPVLQRQMLPPQPLNKPAQQRRERLFRTGPQLSCGQIAYLINVVMEISKKMYDCTLMHSTFVLLLFSLVFGLTFSALWILPFFQISFSVDRNKGQQSNFHHLL